MLNMLERLYAIIRLFLRFKPIVKELPPAPIPVLVVSSDKDIKLMLSFQKVINDSKYEISLTDDALLSLVDKIIYEILPTKYKRSIQTSSKDVLLTRFEFNDNVSIMKLAWPILKSRLDALEFISDLNDHYVTIDVASITKAVEKWQTTGEKTYPFLLIEYAFLIII